MQNPGHDPRTYRLIYIHAGFQAIAMTGGEGFVFLYLLKAGLGTAFVFLCIGAMFASRLLFRMAVVPIAIRFGLRNTLIVSVLTEGASYLLLPMITAAGLLLYLYLAIWAISSSFYWTTYHAYVSELGSNDQRGAQVSTMEFIATFASIVAPIGMGFLLTWFNPWVGFATVTMAMCAGAVPFFFGPKIAVARHAEVPLRSRAIARLLMLTDGLRAAATHFVWLIVLFLTLGSNYVSFGGALAISGITGAIMGLFAGKWIDTGKGIRAARIGFGLMLTTSIAKCLGFATPVTAVAANAANAVAWPSYATAVNSQIYTLARKSPCPLRFNVVSEGGWDMGMTLGCGAGALFVYMGFGFFWPLAIGIAASIAGYFVLASILTEQG